MGTRSRFALVALAVVIAVLVIAVPAQAATVQVRQFADDGGPGLTHANWPNSTSTSRRSRRPP